MICNQINFEISQHYFIEGLACDCSSWSEVPKSQDFYNNFFPDYKNYYTFVIYYFQENFYLYHWNDIPTLQMLQLFQLI